MAQKHLHELLKEDQEPFQLKNYIEDRRVQLKRSSNPKTTTLQSKKRKPIIESTSTKRSLCKQACFFSFQDSPDVLKSPFPDFLSPAAAATAKSPCKSPNGAVFLHIPARTAALLLEAAIRIQKQKQNQSSESKHKAAIKKFGFGLFGSFLHRLKDRNPSKKRQIGRVGIGFLAEDSFLTRVKASSKNKKCQIRQDIEVAVDNKSGGEISYCYSCNNSRHSTTGWSDSIEEKSLDLDTTTTTSTRSEDSAEEIDKANFFPSHKHFCSSHLSPFRFSPQRISSSGHRKPDFLSPVASPSHHKKQEEKNYEAESLRKTQQSDEGAEKEQCSPVSILDPPFEDDDDEIHECGDEHDEDEDDYDLECSYAVVQRVKHQLLQKLRRFEKLAELDPIELEKRMLEEQDEEGGLEIEEYEDDGAISFSEEKGDDDFVREVFGISSLHNQLGKIPDDSKKLLLDLIVEEKREENAFEDNEVIKKKVCQRLDSWKEVESNTIDMMVELDFRRSELDGWKSYQQQVGEATMEIELAIFGLLVEELSEELVC